MKCNKCGTEIPVGSGFCPKCGEMISIMSTNSTGNTDTGAVKKTDNKNILPIIFAILVVVLIIVVIGVFATRKNRSDSEKTETEQTVEISKQDQPEEPEDDESREKLAIEAAEKCYGGFMSWLADVTTKTATMDDVNKHENNLVELLSKWYPQDVEDILKGIIWKGMALDDLSEDDLEYMQEEMDIDIDVKGQNAEKLDEDEINEIKAALEDELGQSLNNPDWGYRVEAQIRMKQSGTEDYVQDGYIYTLYIDGKCGVYALESNGKMDYVTNWW